MKKLVLILALLPSLAFASDAEQTTAAIAKQMQFLQSITFRYTDWSEPDKPFAVVLGRYLKSFSEAFAGIRSTGTATSNEVMQKASEASIIFFGDYHSEPPIQREATRMFGELSQMNDRPKIFIAEFVFQKYQRQLDSYLAGEITVDQLKKEIHWGEIFNEPWWPGYRELLEELKAQGARVVAGYPDDEKHSWADLTERDNYVFSVVKTALDANPRLQVFLLHGQAHLIGKGGLGDRLSRIFPNTVSIHNHITSLYIRAKQLKLSADTYLRLSPLGEQKNVYYINLSNPAKFDLSSLKGLNSLLVESKRESLNQLADGTDKIYQALIEDMANGKDVSQSLSQLKYNLREWLQAVEPVENFENPEVRKAAEPILKELAVLVR